MRFGAEAVYKKFSSTGIGAGKKRIMAVLEDLTAISVLCAGIVLSDSCGIAVIGVLLVILAFEMSTVQACIPRMLTGDNIIRGNAVAKKGFSGECPVYSGGKAGDFKYVAAGGFFPVFL